MMAHDLMFDGWENNVAVYSAVQTALIGTQ